ncbi:putative DNA repair helicase [Pseudorhizobium banfieldiae]|uniref:Putative DNA repair helicase n=1 Tax=Pseudorhizobium banfieldiae TaxID=1125847 RepID=L0NCN1_9HYPH|nr:DEAD/DEAH box helicase family protein [Pseudorhizobium banfieldiae]CAD6600442.1 helicase [arsenite-oxidising bacterium NT-25]CCF18082.1 putative DNA repair helicase [Pseudorhizobium banfieldiae]
MLRALELKTNYTSEFDNIYSDFFLPSLREAVQYQRAVGFFSLGVLLNAPAAMSTLVSNGGRIELIFSKLVAPEDFEAIKAGSATPWSESDFPDFARLIKDNAGSLLEYRIRILAWLFSKGSLEIKVAVRPNGMFHQKIGLLRDRHGDIISFSGSMNETMSALDPRFNSEEITVFRSWNSGQKEYVENHATNFARLWSGDTGSSTIICGLPEAIEQGLKFVMEQFSEAPTPEEEASRISDFVRIGASTGSSMPRVPATLHGIPFGMRDHQLEALRAWSSNGYNGILELATGSGKTITAIYAATKTSQANEGIALIVSVPYQALADQWCEELRLFNIHAIRCYGNRNDWEPVVQSYLRRNSDQQKEFIAVVVVNKTLKTDHFQAFAERLDRGRLFFIGDECHHHGSSGYLNKLFPGAKFRIGLSATPFHYLDEAANQRLRDVYNRSVYQYTLADAVSDGVLTPYEYFPVPVRLTVAEAQDYLNLSDQIARAFAAARNDVGGPLGEKLKSLLMRRARLIGAASNKMTELNRLLDRHKVGPHSLFYCSDGRTLEEDDEDEDDFGASVVEVRQRHAVAQALMKRNVRVSPFTSEENRAQRREILRQFKDGETEALVAIRCLDEGIDVPACRTAYLIASSRNPRQFIQRRGRILRRAPGKEVAIIYDFVVVLPEETVPNEKIAADFLRNELDRVADFAGNSLYPASSIQPLLPWLQKYDLEHFAS